MSTPDWKLNLKKGKSYAPKNILTKWPTKTTTSQQIDAENHSQPTIKKVHAFLESHDSDANTNTIDTAEIYSIIGCGFSATTNRATLRSEDLGNLKVNHIGFPDPWSGYVSHNMNQAVELNTIPGFKNQPALPNENLKTKPQERWLKSDVFAACTETERQRFVTEGLDEDNKAGAVTIRLTNSKKNFMITLSNKKKITAKKIDILTGTGQQEILKTFENDKDYGIKMSSELWQEYLEPVKMSGGDTIHKIVSAEMYVRKTSLPKADGLFCITGASPAGIQAMEHALCQDDGTGSKMSGGVLIDSGEVNSGFLGIGRLDAHARDQQGQELHFPRESIPKGPLYPHEDGVWFAEGYRVDSVEILVEEHKEMFENITDSDIENSRLIVAFRRVKSRSADEKNPIRVVNNKHKSALGADEQEDESYLYGKFDQLVLGTGRLRGGRGTPEKQSGSALDLVWEFKDSLERIEFDTGFPLGLKLNGGDLESHGKQLRILGAAGINNPAFKKERYDADYKKFSLYESSLPVHSRVNGEGVTLAGHTIAWANKLFTLDNDQKLNRNINTATLDELKKALNNDKLADLIYKARACRVGPFIDHVQARNALAVYQYYVARAEDAPTNLDKLLRQKKVELKKYRDEINLKQKEKFRLEKRNSEIEMQDFPSLDDANELRQNIEKIKAIKSEINRLSSQLSHQEKIITELESKKVESIVDFMNNDKWLFSPDFNKRADQRIRKALGVLMGLDETPELSLDKQLSDHISKLKFRPNLYLEDDSYNPVN